MVDMRGTEAGVRDADGVKFDRLTRVSRSIGGLVPMSLARRAVTVSVSTDRQRYERGDAVELTANFKNWLPVPVEIPTPKQRPWGWDVNGELEASDERVHTRENPSAFRFSGGERKQVEFVWNGRFERTEGVHEWVTPAPGEYEITVFVATHPRTHRLSDSTTVRIE